MNIFYPPPKIADRCFFFSPVFLSPQPVMMMSIKGDGALKFMVDLHALQKKPKNVKSVHLLRYSTVSNNLEYFYSTGI